MGFPGVVGKSVIPHFLTVGRGTPFSEVWGIWLQPELTVKSPMVREEGYEVWAVLALGRK